MRLTTVFVVAIAAVLCLFPFGLRAQPLADRVGAQAGIAVLVGFPGGGAASVVDLLQDNELTVLFQSGAANQVREVQQLGTRSRLLGRRLFAVPSVAGGICLADSLADCVVVGTTGAEGLTDAEIFRVLRPGGTAYVGDRVLHKDLPAGTDDWSHPYHGPDNNPQSRDRLARGRLLTQFLADPMFCAMPEQTVAAGGRLFKAIGHIAHKANQNTYLNTLLCINAYNGSVLWQRPLPEGFMIHRNTMVATADALYMGDHESCKVIDARTGEVSNEITFPSSLVDGPVWKWMAIRDGVLYALIGGEEVHIDTQHSNRAGLGHWPWGMWQGHDYKDPITAFGFGRTLIAFDVAEKRIRWHRRTDLYLDGRALCMNSRRIFAYSPEKALLAVDCGTGEIAWQQTGREVLDAIGPNLKAQHYVTGYSTTCYAKCDERYLFFAGPQRGQMAVMSAEDGTLAWTHPDGNLQLVLRDDAIYAAGPETTGVRLDYETGKILSKLPTRRACTRATGTADSVFYRAQGGTIRVLTETGGAHHIAAMRPPCQDGVIIANGLLYWGPWMCGCQLSLYGNIGLAPAGPEPGDDAMARGALVGGEGAPGTLAPLGLEAGDWPAYRGDNQRSDTAHSPLPLGFQEAWRVEVCEDVLPTAPVAAGGMAFVADRTGLVKALDLTSGSVVWTQMTSAPIYFPPAIAHDRAFVGSADGYVYAFAAKTGRLLWRYRVAPLDQRIPVYGTLISRWPVAGGVVVEGDSVYAAAGIANHDGTHVVALSALTGEPRAVNRGSGDLAPEVGGGISLQGPLMIVDGELRFLGGGVYETARFALGDLACLNAPVPGLSSSFQTAFYPYYPEYGKYVSLHHRTPYGVLSHAASYEGSAFGSLVLQPPSPGDGQPIGEAVRSLMRRRGQLVPGGLLWQDGRSRRFTAFIAGDETLLAAGHDPRDPGSPFIATTRVRDGAPIWRFPLPAGVVKGGMAIDHAGRLLVALENGSLLCLRPDLAIQPPAERTAEPPPAETRLVFSAGLSMKPFPVGTRQGNFPIQETDDALGPFSGKGIYFSQREGQDTEVVYEINSHEPVREIRFIGAASFGLRLEICTLDGAAVLAVAGPFHEGNVPSEHAVTVPPTAGQRFILRLHNEASTWLYIERLELRQ